MAGRELVSLLDFVHKRRLPGDGMEGLTSVWGLGGTVTSPLAVKVPLSARN